MMTKTGHIKPQIPTFAINFLKKLFYMVALDNNVLKLRGHLSFYAYSVTLKSPCLKNIFTIERIQIRTNKIFRILLRTRKCPIN